MKRKLLAAMLSVVMMFSLATPVTVHADAPAADPDWYASGSGGEWVIYDAGDLLAFAQKVKDGETFSGKTVKLGADIDMSGVEDFMIGNFVLTSGSTAGYTDYDEFQGTFDGQGHTISNLDIAPATGGNRCLGMFSSANNATIKNFTLENPTLTRTSNAERIGIVLGNAHTGTVRLSGITVTGGIVTATSATSGSIGGLVGGNFGAVTIEDCSMDAAISGTTKTGGIVGYAGAGSLTARNCTATGSVAGTGADIGGIIGSYTPNGVFTVTGCTVNAAISGTASLAGIVGSMAGTGKKSITNCTVSGSVTGTGAVGAGVIGVNTGAGAVEVTNCTVSAGVRNTGWAAGIMSHQNNASGSVTVTDCYFSGTAEATANGRCAGVLGFVTAGSTVNISYCTVTGTVGYANMSCNGGIFGQCNGSTTILIEKSTVAATIVGGTTGSYIGNVNTGTITLDSNYTTVTNRNPQGAGTPTVVALASDSFDSATESIGNANHLLALAYLSKTANFADAELTLTANLDLTGIAFPMFGSGTLPFAGKFDGGNHIITGLQLNTDARYTGLFSGVAGGWIKNLTLADVSVTSSVSHDYAGVGALIGSTASGAYTVENVTVTSAVVSVPNGGCAGVLVGTNMANLAVTNCFFSGSVDGKDRLGGMVGYSDSGSLSLVNCRSNVAVTATGSYAGGMVGNDRTTLTVTGCEILGSVSGLDCLGGITGSVMGNNTAVTVSNTRFGGTVTSTKEERAYLGGLVGQLAVNTDSLTATDVLMGGAVTKEGTAWIGGIIGTGTNGSPVALTRVLVTGTVSAAGGCVGAITGNNTTLTGTVTDCYAVDSTPSSSSRGGLGATPTEGKLAQGATILTAAQLTGANAIINAHRLNFADGTWAAVEDGTPVLAALSGAENVYDAAAYGVYDAVEGAYLISTAAQLKTMANLSKKDNFSNITLKLANDVENVGSFPMFGSNSVPFAGIFDGSGYTVSGVEVTVTAGSSSSITPAGFFARISGATIENFRLTDSVINSNAPYAGAIVGRATGGTNTVSGVYSDAAVTGYSMSGGLIGFASDDVGAVTTTVNLSDSWFAGSVAVDHNAVGGLVGQAGNEKLTLNVTDCLFTGAISCTDNDAYVGGLVGRVHASTAVTLTDCVSAGTQTQGGLVVGSITGSGSANLTDVYAVAIDELPAILSGAGEATILAASQLTGYSAVVNATGLDFAENWTAIDGDIVQPTAVKNGVTAATPGNYFADISAYRGETYTAPTAPEGKIFAGWYLDEANTVALEQSETTGAAFAKFVDQNILRVRYQFKQADSLSNDKVTMRVLTTVDSQDYQGVTFVFNYNEKEKLFTSTRVYSSISGTDKNGESVTYTPTSKIGATEEYYWSADSQYICGYNINISSSLYDTPITVSAKWITADGTIVSGDARGPIIVRSDSAFAA